MNFDKDEVYLFGHFCNQMSRPLLVIRNSRLMALCHWLQFMPFKMWPKWVLKNHHYLTSCQQQWAGYAKWELIWCSAPYSQHHGNSVSQSILTGKQILCEDSLTPLMGNVFVSFFISSFTEGWGRGTPWRHGLYHHSPAAQLMEEIVFTLIKMGIFY